MTRKSFVICWRFGLEPACCIVYGRVGGRCMDVFKTDLTASIKSIVSPTTACLASPTTISITSNKSRVDISHCVS
ncbi:uncharacterized protein K452DRAFT_41764 [Aplosporella prunicola CBS 121167]|uniref:Uncharacterized protein n=1 Tax=Aplosporella prunicola CBS 121167 TaxID=1176127 RepID=A0A6A6BC78_9PEZI|nr:uncharacterized protein K452DRAFT_41764 [Aplosporella prunicola CBS 121167]KAF2140854.1 hypothetical protein K452DRAFT_41764 [Aplosporella prunicola CBS 121167]